MSSAGVFPGWVLLEPYVFRRYDNRSFPEVTEAPIRASATTSWGTYFRIAFSLAEPPQISRLYAQLPGFPGPEKEVPLAMLATHRQLSMLATHRQLSLLQDFVIFRANEDKPSSSSLTVLPPCTLPWFDHSRADGSLPRRRPRHHLARPRLLDLRSLGLWCKEEEEEFVVAELTPYVPTIERRRTKAFADIRLLRDVQLGRRKWWPLRIPIPSTTNDDLWKLSRWQTDTVIPFQQWLCWVDYHRGILFCDVSNKDQLHVSFLWFPLDVDTNTMETTCNIYYGGVSVVNHGCLLKFVNVERHDGLVYGALKPGTGFTLVIGGGTGGMTWKKEEDYTVTSDDLPAYLQRQRGMPIFPRVDIERPHVVHILFIEFQRPYEKMPLLSIDMRTKSLVYFDLYMDGNEFFQSGNIDTAKCSDPTSSLVSSPGYAVYQDNCHACLTNKYKINHPSADPVDDSHDLRFGGQCYEIGAIDHDWSLPPTMIVDYLFFDSDRDNGLVEYLHNYFARVDAYCSRLKDNENVGRRVGSNCRQLA